MKNNRGFMAIYVPTKRRINDNPSSRKLYSIKHYGIINLIVNIILRRTVKVLLSYISLIENVRFYYIIYFTPLLSKHLRLLRSRGNMSTCHSNPRTSVIFHRIWRSVSTPRSPENSSDNNLSFRYSLYGCV